MTFNLGNVVDRLNLAHEKMITNNTKGEAILETLYQVGNTHNVLLSGEKKDPHGVIQEINFMRKSLQSQLKIEGHKTFGCDENSQCKSKKPAAGERGCSAGKMSSFLSGIGTKRNDTDKKCYRKGARATPLTSKHHTTLSRPQENKRRVCSRHKTPSTPIISIDNSCKDHFEMNIRKNSQSKVLVSENLSSRRQGDSERESNTEFEVSNCDDELCLSNCLDPENGGVGERKMLPNEISCDEKEVLNQFTDPQIRESLQNIIKRRRSSVRFVKSESGYEMVNIEPKISESLEEQADEHKQKLAESKRVVEIGDSSETRKETRVIRPAAPDGYVPNLTSRKILRKVSAMSCPEITRKRDEAKTLAQVNMIREFLLMYTKVAAKNEDTLPGRKPVRMMSQTPELVIKSAIGQFLTCAFPSDEIEEWTGLGGKSKKERYEEQQRSKLLRIKICMKHLASVA
ncbi:hypothetical protein AWC38_SpisGene4477 [Stylophora pistillata]|uniref:BEN domain-containing protein n=1 Tax=Stylophora pistillata TaxID=50429 RepID=A0A2B4SJ67_STYPI|nr:hypothetical protein AWC38_SpisGene4477 [Stylophora pistillata]